MSQENKYDNPRFFEQYKNMPRSVRGLAGAGEWHEFRKLMPDFRGKRVLDLGCGFGWHCRYALEQGAESVIGVDLSENMLATARTMGSSPKVSYLRAAIEEIDFAPAAFDIVISSLAFHYVEDFDALCQRIDQILSPGGDLVFSIEHPIFTAQGPQQWVLDGDGKIDHWPLDRYFDQGRRDSRFLGETVVKYHRTLTDILAPLLSRGFSLKQLVEPQPDATLLSQFPEARDELRRPMMLLLSLHKNT